MSTTYFKFGGKVGFGGPIKIRKGPGVVPFTATLNAGPVNPSDAGTTDNFGYSLACNGLENEIFMGSNANNSQKGAVYRYSYDGTTWNNVSKWYPVANSTQFGSSLFFHGSSLLVGAPQGTSGSAVYMINKSGTPAVWPANSTSSVRIDQISGTVKFTTATNQIDYGRSVVMNDSYVVIGAPGTTVSSQSNSGKVFIYRYNSGAWDTSTVITCQQPTPTANAYFGNSVAISGTTLIVGAPGEGTNNQGAVYSYDLTTLNWSNLTISAPAQVLPAVRQQWSYFGSTMKVSGSTLVIGASGMRLVADTGTHGFTGCLYVFTQGGNGVWNQWQQFTVAKDTSVDPLTGTTPNNSGLSPTLIDTKFAQTTTTPRLGFSIDITSDGNTIIASAPWVDGTTSSGSAVGKMGGVYIFQNNRGHWAQSSAMGNPCLRVTNCSSNCSMQFGTAAALRGVGTEVIFTAYQYSSGKGAFYHFK